MDERKRHNLSMSSIATVLFLANSLLAGFPFLLAYLALLVNEMYIQILRALGDSSN